MARPSWRAPSAPGCTRLDSPPNEAKYRCHWTAPLALDPFDHNTVYYGCQVIFKTSNAGQSWSVISPDLSTQDPARNGPSGGIVGDNLGQFYGEVVFAIAPSPLQKGMIWAGTNDGLVWITKDAGGHWTNVGKNIPGLPAWGSITSISPSTFDAGTAYVSVDFHLNDNRDPFIYKTLDFGQTWTKISDGLPKHQLSYVRSVTEDPNQKGLLFAGTGNGLYYSLDAGSHWTGLQTGLPHCAGDVGHGAEAVSRPGGLDLWPRLLHSRRHYAARADGPGGHHHLGPHVHAAARGALPERGEGVRGLRPEGAAQGRGAGVDRGCRRASLSAK